MTNGTCVGSGGAGTCRIRALTGLAADLRSSDFDKDDLLSALPLGFRRASALPQSWFLMTENSSISWTAKTAICPPSMIKIKKKNNFDLNFTGHAAKTARAVIKLVNKIKGIEIPSAPTAHVSPISGSQLTLSLS